MAYKLFIDEIESSSYIRFNFRKLCFLIFCLTLITFIYCILYSLIFHFDSSTRTVCKAFNVLPSISSAIGGYSPQKEVWKTVIILQSPFRISMAYFYCLYNFEVSVKRSKLVNALIYLASILHFIENISLVSLSVFDSSNYYPIHEKSFILFILSSEFNMFIIIYLHQFHRQVARNIFETNSLKWKKISAFVNISNVFLAGYFFIVHNTDCPDFAYTKFAFCEYIVVISNMYFHFTAAYDFYGKDLILYKGGMHLTPR